MIFMLCYWLKVSMGANGGALRGGRRGGEDSHGRVEAVACTVARTYRVHVLSTITALPAGSPRSITFM